VNLVVRTNWIWTIYDLAVTTAIAPVDLAARLARSPARTSRPPSSIVDLAASEPGGGPR
jgi:hypothetical protein